MITEDGKVEFNETEQAEVNRIIGERLARTGIHEKDEIIETLKDFGYDTSDLASVKAEIKAQAEEFKRQQQETIEQERLEQLKEQAKEEGTTPALLAKIEKLEKKLSEIDGEREALKNAEQQRAEIDKMFSKQVTYFMENEPEVDLTKLNENPKFIKFLNKQRPSDKADFLVEVYKDYMELVGNAESEATAKIKANLDRSTSSGRGKGDPAGGTYGLTANQQSLAEENGMTYKEYADFLKQIRK